MPLSSALVIDDEEDIRLTFKDFLEEKGFEVFTAGEIHEAIEILRTTKPDVIFLDIQLPGMTGIEILTKLKDVKIDIPIVMMSGYATEEMARDTLKLGAFDYLSKPFELTQIERILTSLEISHF